MIKCDVNSDTISEQAEKIKSDLRSIQRDINYTQKARDYFLDLFKTYKEQFAIEDARTLIEGIFPSISRIGRLSQKDSEFFNIENLVARLEDSYKGVSFNNVQNNSSEQVEKQVEETNPYKGTEALEAMYPLAPTVYINAKYYFNSQIVNGFILDRDNKLAVKTNEDLNISVRRLKQKLLDTIYEYLKDDKTFNAENFQLYNDNGQYSNKFSKAQYRINSTLQMDTNQLLKTYNQMRLGSTKAKIKMDAYNAFALLTNFDSYVSQLFGKNILINQGGTFKATYAFADKNMVSNKTWRSTENYDPEKEVNGFLKLIIDTIPIYQASTNNRLLGYVKFNQFQNSIKQLKELSLVDLDLLRPDLEETLQDALTDKEYNIIQKYKKLSNLVNSVRLHPNNISILYKLFSNSQFKQIDTISKIIDKWGPLDLDITYSVFKGLEDIKNTDEDFFNAVQHQIDSTSANKLLQYFYNDDNSINIRELKDLNLSNLKRQIEYTINGYNARSLNKYERLCRLYNIVNKNVTEGVQKSIEISFVIPNTGIEITYNSKTGEEIYVNGIKQSGLNESIELTNFVENILGINLEDDVYKANLLAQYGNKSEQMYADLTKFAAQVLNYIHASNTIFKDVTDIKKMEELKKDYFNEKGVQINYQSGDINYVDFSTSNTTLDNLNIAQSYTYGLNAATTVKDGKGNQQNTVNQSRLLDNIGTQFLLINQNKNNPMFGSLLLSNPKVFKGVYTIKEFYGQDKDVKSYLDFTVSEQIQAQILYDYIKGLSTNKDDSSLLGNGVVAINPSENSDKPNSNRILIDLNQPIPRHLNPNDSITLANATYEDLVDFIRKEFHEIYEKQQKQVDFDWIKLLRVNGEVIPADGNYFAVLNAKENPQDTLEMWIRNYNELSIKDRIDKYNENLSKEEQNKNRDDFKDPIMIVDQTHYVKIQDEFNDKRTIFRGNPARANILRRYSSFENALAYFKQQESLIINDLEKENLQIKILSDTTNKHGNAPVKKGLERLGKSEWIDSSGYMITNKNGQLHPELAKYNLINFLFSEEWLIAGVGTYINHPNKYYEELYKSQWEKNNAIKLFGLSEDEKNSLWETAQIEHYNEDEAARKKAQNKRNVSWTAQMLEFTRGFKNGIPDNYKVAIVTDIKNKQYNAFGAIKNIAPYDGATFANPIMVYLENNSLGTDAAGFIKKPFIHYYIEKLGIAGIIKTASFGITNDHMRTSTFERVLNRKMNDIAWRDENNTFYVADITKVPLKKDIYYEKDGKYYQLVKIINEGNNYYTIKTQQVSRSGNVIKDVDTETEEHKFINSNYKLWELLGGYKSMSLKDGVLKYSEASIVNLIDYVNGITEQRNHLDSIQDADEKEYYQPLKESMIHYVITEGAIKQGAANINNINDITDSNNPLLYYQFRMTQGGIQLDKEHESSEADLSLMTQVWNACALRGFTFDYAKDLYESLTKFAENTTNTIVDNLVETVLNSNDRDKAYSIINKLLVKSLADDNSQSFATKIARDIITELRSGKEINWSNPVIPFSDNSVYNKLVSVITVALTKSGIKSKIPGTLAIISPAYGNMKIYGGKKLSQWKDGELEVEQKKYDDNPIISSTDVDKKYQDVEIGRWYKLYNLDTDQITDYIVKTPLERKNFIEQLKSINYNFKLVENIIKGRDLASYNIKFETTDGNHFSLYDLDSVNDLFKLKNKISEEEYYNLEKKYFVIENGNHISKDRLETAIRDLVEKELNIISNTSPITGTIKINNVEYTVDPNSVNIQPYELIMSKKYIEQFGLDQDTQPSDITSPAFFFKRALNRFKSNLTDSKLYDVELKSRNGKHIYLIDKSKISNLKKAEHIKINKQYTQEDELWRVDYNGNKLYRLADKKDGIYDYNGVEIIATDLNLYLKDYLNWFKYTDIIFSDQLDNETIKNYLNKFDVDSKLQNDILNTFNYSNEDDVQDYTIINKARASINKIRVPNTWNKIKQLIQAHPELRYMYEDSIKVYNSFKKSLEIIASRTPAQSMQSAMIMKVVGFDNPDSNVAYVCDAQLWLQGSDLDIDTVNLATYYINKNGILPTWSPYTDYRQLDKSMKLLPFPTGKKLELNEYDYDAHYKNNFQQFIGDYGVFKIIPKKVKSGNKTVTVNHIIFNKNANLENITLLLKYAKENYFFKPTQTTLSTFCNHFNLSEDEANKFFNLLENVINKHNLYLKNPHVNIQGILANRQLFDIFTILGAPENQIQAMMSVDDITKEPKDITKDAPENQVAKQEMAENFMTKIHDFFRSQVGKKGVGICASGLKTFEALTYAYNYFLRYGTEEEQRKLLFDKTVEGKSYHLLANAFTKNTEKLIPEIKNALKNMSDKDAALEISALLGLSVDNAKELKLFMLNADANTLGMYLYGSMIGVPMRTIAKHLMSDVGKIYTKLLSGNVFNDKIKFYNFTDVYDYLHNGFDIIKYYRDANKGMSSSDILATKILQQHLEHEPKDIQKEFKDEKGEKWQMDSYSIFKYLNMFNAEENKLELLNKLESNNLGTLGNDIIQWYNYSQKVQSVEKYNIDIDNISAAIKTFQINLSTNDNISQKCEDLSRIVNTYGKLFNSNDLKTIYEAIDDIEISNDLSQLNLYSQRLLDYIQASYAAGDDTILALLSAGSQELRNMGKILKLNQGLPTKVDEILDLVNSIENIINVSDNTRVHKIEDLLNPSKLNTIVQDYESKKITFNIPLMISVIPHFNYYLKLLVAAHKSCMHIQRYQTQYNELTRVRPMGRKNTELISRGSSNYSADYIINKFLFEHAKQVAIPNGIKYYDGSGEPVDVKGAYQIIQLGTDSGNASFKRWMDTYVIPRLKEGYVSYDSTKSAVAQTNQFLQELTPTLFSLNVSKNTSINYSLNINMLPKTDNERMLFNNLKNEFNKLRVLNYIMINGQSIPVTDLLFLYNLVAYANKQGMTNLSTIFEDYTKYGVYKEYIDFASQFEKTGKILVDQQKINYYEAGIGNDFSKEKFSYIKSKTSFNRLLAEKTSNSNNIDLEGSEDISEFKNHKIIGTKLDWNYFIKGMKGNSAALKVVYNNEEYTLGVVNNEATKLYKGDKEIDLKGNTIVIRPKYSALGSTVDVENIQKQINTILQCKQ